VLEGALAHKDSMGNVRELLPGQIQLMSAGTGVTHSEFNPSREATTHMLQIWITPKQRNLKPSYTEWHPQPSSDGGAKVLVISHDGREGSATIHQDADIYRVRLQPGQQVSHGLGARHGLWLQVMRGSLRLNDEAMSTGDAASCEAGGCYAFTAGDAGAEALLFDLG
jgi:quercetin 2,3-dioxygenase